MKIVTWNVNSLRARLELVTAWLDQHKPDVVCLQETKCMNEQFPAGPIEELGYEIAMLGQKSYNGVAILTRRRLDEVRYGFEGDPEDATARAIGGSLDDWMFLNLYVVNGQSVGAPKYDVKLQWLDALSDHVAEHYPMTEKVVLCGDFNITFDDRDIYDPDKWRDKILCSEPEREALAKLMKPGLIDAFRKFTEEGEHYTWWDFRTRGFRRNRGLRIDHFLVSPPALEACTKVWIDTEARAAEKPSDHAPVVAEFD